MRINTFGEFYMFLSSNGLRDANHDIGVFCSCINQYNLLCTCKKNEKSRKGSECNSQYIHIVNNILPTMKSQLFKNTQDMSIEFYHNQSFMINVITR